MAQLVGDGEGSAQSVVFADAAAPVRIANRSQLGQAWSDKTSVGQSQLGHCLDAYAGQRALTQGVALVPRSANVLPAVVRRRSRSAEPLTSQLTVSFSSLKPTISAGALYLSVNEGASANCDLTVSFMVEQVAVSPGDEDGRVVVGVVAVVQDVLALLPDAKVLQSGLGIEGNDRTLLRERESE